MVSGPRKPSDVASAIDYGRTALAFVDNVSGLKSKAAIFEVFEKAISEFGFSYFAMASLSEVDRPLTVLLAKPPIGWTEFYLEHRYQLYDPVIHLCRSNVHPFVWNDIGLPPRGGRQALEVMHRADDFGLKQGLTVPIHGFDGAVSCVSLGASDQPFVNRHTIPAIHLMAIYAFEQARRLSSCEKIASPLTPRETEVLTWAAAGKSAAGIAAVLNITERTAIAHTVNATQKLGASNKTHAVAIALRNRLIGP